MKDIAPINDLREIEFTDEWTNRKNIFPYYPMWDIKKIKSCFTTT